MILLFINRCEQHRSLYSSIENIIPYRTGRKITKQMRATVFEPLLELYELRYPSRKSLPNKIIPKAETLALSFYSHVFSQVIGINWPVCCLPSRLATGEPVREAYTNLFYSLGHANQAALDFVGCVICLLSQPIFSCQECQTSPKVQTFLQNLENSHIKLRQHLFIVYTQETIGYKTSKESAIVLFSHCIVSQLNCFSNLGTKMRVNLQLREVQANIQKKGEEVDIRPRVKKRTKYQQHSKVNYREQIKSIMRSNQIEIEEEAKMNRKFQKFINKCITEGENEVSEVLYKKSPSVIKLSTFLNTIKNCNTFISKLKKKADINNQNQRSYEHWKKVVHDMKNLSYLTRKQVISALSVSDLERSLQIHPEFHLPSSSSAQVTRRPASKAMIEIPQRSLHTKKTIPRNQNTLPNLKDFSQANKNITMQPCLDERPMKIMYQNSRKLKREFSDFMNERRSRQLH